MRVMDIGYRIINFDRYTINIDNFKTLKLLRNVL
jgi:hypothetical protein